MKLFALAVAIGLVITPARAEDDLATACAYAVVGVANSYLKAKEEGATEEQALAYLNQKLDETEQEALAKGKNPRPNRAIFEGLIRAIYAGKGESEAMLELHKECMVIERRMQGVSA